ncbi:MFS transporter [Actinomycetota bacterium]
MTAPTTTPPTAPSSGRGSHVGLATAALVLGGFSIGTTEFVSMGLLPQIAETLKISIPTAGHIISAYAMGVVIGAPVLAVMFAKYPRKGLLLGLMTVFTVGNVASALADSYPAMIGARLLAGFPHGAFFGVGALVAAGLVEPAKRGLQIGRMMYGIPAANVLGVPLTTWLGQNIGWRSAYWTVAAFGLLTLALVAAYVPKTPGNPEATGRRELSALSSPTLWLSILAGSLGFGGMFAMYSYIAPTITDVTRLHESAVPTYLLVYGLGGLLGAEIAGRMSEWSIRKSVVIGFALMALMLAAFSWLSPWHIPGMVVFFLSALVASILVVNLQMQLMHDAGDAETIGAALNHSALNIANALGAWIGGIVIALGYGYRAPSLVGAGMALVGILILVAYRQLDRRRANPLR